MRSALRQEETKKMFPLTFPTTTFLPGIKFYNLRLTPRKNLTVTINISSGKTLFVESLPQSAILERLSLFYPDDSLWEDYFKKVNPNHRPAPDVLKDANNWLAKRNFRFKIIGMAIFENEADEDTARIDYFMIDLRRWETLSII